MYLILSYQCGPTKENVARTSNAKPFIEKPMFLLLIQKLQNQTHKAGHCVIGKHPKNRFSRC